MSAPEVASRITVLAAIATVPSFLWELSLGNWLVVLVCGSREPLAHEPSQVPPPSLAGHPLLCQEFRSIGHALELMLLGRLTHPSSSPPSMQRRRGGQLPDG
jgi:hypothetical protein